MGTAQRSWPFAASSATHASRFAPSTSRATMVNTLPPPTEKELNPVGVGDFQICGSPLSGHALTGSFSGEIPS